MMVYYHAEHLLRLLTLSCSRFAGNGSRFAVTCYLLTLLFSACQREPELLLVDREVPVEFETDKIILDLDVLWEYELTYDWEAQWYYGWDERDDSIFGRWEIVEPNVFNVRRYHTGEDAQAPHTSVLRDMVHGNKFQAKYKYGFYDILVWNDVNTLDGVQSLHYDEETSLEYITAYTNQSPSHTSVPNHSSQHNAPSQAPPAYAQPYRAGYAFYQPEFLFSGEYDNLHVSNDPADYDSLIVETNTWYKFVPLTLTPITYIYLTQVILHHNRGRVTNVDGSGNLTGMARSVNLNSHVTSEQDVSINYPMLMKRDIPLVDSLTQQQEQVDVIGGRVMTFGLTGVNPYSITRADGSYKAIAESQIPNYLEVNMVFYNGNDSTFVFDITDQVRERYKGGVITIHLDVDQVNIPSKSGGSLFDAVVKEFEEETHEFEM